MILFIDILEYLSKMLITKKKKNFFIYLYLSTVALKKIRTICLKTKIYKFGEKKRNNFRFL